MAGTVRKIKWTTRKGEEKTAWVADYFDQRRKRHTRNFTSKKAAEAWLLQVRVEVRAGIHTPEAGSITVAEAGRLWLERGEAEGLERITLQTYRTLLDLHITPLIGHLRLAQLTTPEVEAFRDELLQRMSRRYARSVLVGLKSIIANAQRRGLIAHNPATATRVNVVERHQERLEIGRDVPSKSEVQAIINNAAGRWRTMLITAAFTGMRAGELRGLTWDEIDLPGKLVRIRQRADTWGTQGAPKSAAGRREIPLMPIVIAALREWRLAYPFGPEGIVFCRSQRVRDAWAVTGHATLWWVFHRAQRAAGVVDEAGQPKYKFHALRHFFASIGIEAGFAPKRLQALLGHSSISMTFDTYGHLFPNPEDDHARLAAMERAVFGNKS